MKIVITKQEAIDAWRVRYPFLSEARVIEIEDDSLEYVNTSQISSNGVYLKEMPNAVPLPYIQNLC